MSICMQIEHSKVQILTGFQNCSKELRSYDMRIGCPIFL